MREPFPLSDWEVGNDILCGVMDKMHDLARECEKTHPDTAALLRKQYNELKVEYKKLAKEQALV